MPKTSLDFVPLPDGDISGYPEVLQFGFSGATTTDPITSLLGGVKTLNAAGATGLTAGGAESVSILSGASAVTMRATGDRSVAIGHDVTGGGTSSVAIGDKASSATFGSVVAIGLNCTAAGTNSTALGNGCTARQSSVAIGQGATMSGGTNIVCIGTGANSANNNGIAIGALSSQAQANSVAVGSGSYVPVTGGVAIGGGTVANQGARATALGAIAIGGNDGTRDAASATFDNGIAIGSGAKVDTANNGIAIGRSVVVTGLSAMAFGIGASAGGSNAVAIGASAKTVGAESLAIGIGTNEGLSSGANSVAIGSNADATGARSVSIGSSIANDVADSWRIRGNSVIGPEADIAELSSGTSTVVGTAVIDATEIIDTTTFSSGALKAGALVEITTLGTSPNYSNVTDSTHYYTAGTGTPASPEANDSFVVTIAGTPTSYGGTGVLTLRSNFAYQFPTNTTFYMDSVDLVVVACAADGANAQYSVGKNDYADTGNGATNIAAVAMSANKFTAKDRERLINPTDFVANTGEDGQTSVNFDITTASTHTSNTIRVMFEGKLVRDE